MQAAIGISKDRDVMKTEYTLPYMDHDVSSKPLSQER